MSGKKSLKILKEYYEAVNRRRTDNTIAIRNRTKRQQCSTNHYTEI